MTLPSYFSKTGGGYLAIGATRARAFRELELMGRIANKQAASVFKPRRQDEIRIRQHNRLNGICYASPPPLRKCALPQRGDKAQVAQKSGQHDGAQLPQRRDASLRFESTSRGDQIGAGRICRIAFAQAARDGEGRICYFNLEKRITQPHPQPAQRRRGGAA